MIGIYKITSPTGKVYIGQSTNIKRRFNEYKRLHCKKQSVLYKSFLKYGVEAHKFETITECNEGELNNLERYYQDLYDVIGENGLNCKLTASNDRSGKLCNGTKEKLSAIVTEYFSKEENRKKQSEIIKKYFNNPENRKKLSLAKKGSKGPNLGKKAKEETRKKQSESKINLYKNGHIHHMKGKKLSKKHKENISKNHQSKKEGYVCPASKQVINTQNGFIYDSIKEAWTASGLKCHKFSFARYLSNKSKNKTNYEYIDNIN